MPTKHLQIRPDLAHSLEREAGELFAALRRGEQQALQRIREFHPRFREATEAVIAVAPFTLSDARQAIAGEYGFSSWAQLTEQVRQGLNPPAERPRRVGVVDPAFRHAVDLLDAGDTAGLRELLQRRPDLVHQQVEFVGETYFTNPTLLEFVAENPVRHDRLPSNIVEVAQLILDAGAKANQRALDSTLVLVSSGRVARECRAQLPLITLLRQHGARPEAALAAAVAHGEFEAAEALLRNGAALDLAAAAALGRTEVVHELLTGADSEQRQRALALAAQHGHAAIVAALLTAGESPDRFNPVGCHPHSTPLHQAAWYGHLDVVRVLVQHGASLDIADMHYHAPPLGWAEYAGQRDVVEFLRSLAGGRPRGGSR